MKKTFSLLAVSAACLAAFGTAVAAPIADGTYTGESMGRNGPVKVQVTTQTCKITNLNFARQRQK